MFTKLKKALTENWKAGNTFVPFLDEAGNELTEEDIYFTTEEKIEDEEKWLTVDTPGVFPLFDEAGNFPIALRTEEGEIAYLKVSGKSQEVLPIHAGCCPMLRIIFVGAPQAGKTVHFLQLCDSDFHDMLARKTTCSFADDLPSSLGERELYEKARSKFKNDHTVPEPTRKNSAIIPYYFYTQYANAGKTKRMLLKLDDIDGETCTELEWESKVFQSNIFMIAIGADELLESGKGREMQYTKVLSQLLPRLRLLRPDKDYQVLIMITKCDCLDLDNEFLQEAKENTIELKDGRLYQKVHEEGFDHEVFEKRSTCIRTYIQNQFPNFYNRIVNTIPEDLIDFCMIASIGEECEGDHFEQYNPMFIDEPILSILSKEGYYPIKGEGPKVEEIPSAFDNFRETFHKSMEKFKDMVTIPETEEDEE